MYFCITIKFDMTLTEEDYLKAIFHLAKVNKSAIATNTIAVQIGIRPSSVTDMVKKLADKGLVNYKKYQGVTLTDQGMENALSIVRKHRLWEVFLVNKLDFSWDEVHEVAEQLEHIKSEKLIDRLDKHLGYPKVDPHGDPIPNKNGKFKEVTKRLLNEIPLNSVGICVGMKDSSTSFLKFLDRKKIALGDNIKVLGKEEFDGSLYINIDGRDLQISNQIASNLYIKEI